MAQREPGRRQQPRDHPARPPWLERDPEHPGMWRRPHPPTPSPSPADHAGSGEGGKGDGDGSAANDPARA